MSDPVIDAAIFILLVISVGFGGIGVIGLLLFPDIRSRMYTAFRATVISISAIILSVIIYALSTFISSGGDQYITLILHSLVLLYHRCSGKCSGIQDDSRPDKIGNNLPGTRRTKQGQ